MLEALMKKQIFNTLGPIDLDWKHCILNLLKLSPEMRRADILTPQHAWPTPSLRNLKPTTLPANSFLWQKRPKDDSADGAHRDYNADLCQTTGFGVLGLCSGPLISETTVLQLLEPEEKTMSCFVISRQ